jgi:predicted cupin superfamily sugar epimerase
MTNLPAWAQGLGLQPHPEGGWYAQTYRHASTVDTPGGARGLATAIYFLLLPDEESAWHRVLSDELWLYHRGGTLRLWIGDTPETAVEHALGPNIDGGHLPQLLVPGGQWQAARPVDEAVLVSCVVVPGFDFADFQLGDPAPV